MCYCKLILLFKVFLSIYGVIGTQDPTTKPTLEPIFSINPTIQPTIEPTTQPSQIIWMNNRTIGSISCNQTLFGSTKFEGDIAYYSLINSNNQNGTYFQIQSCGSQYNAELSLFDKNFNMIVSRRSCDVDYYFTSMQQQMNLQLKLYDDEYIIGIGGVDDSWAGGDSYGDY
eukprot:434346_1